MGEMKSAARRIVLSAGATVFILWLLMYAPSPYVVFEPGIAVPVESMVELANGADGASQQQTAGSFMLTAVRLTDPNIWGVITAGVNPDKDIRWKWDVFGGQSKSKYVEQINEIMDSSQQTALQAAYEYADIPYNIEEGEPVPARPEDRVSIRAEDIGGPSAGLVFALRTIDLLTEGDLTKGLRIAATGTMDKDGSIGAIGGVKQKTVAVSLEGADLFLVPKGNEKQARKTAKRLSSQTVIVGVATLDEAVQAIAAAAIERRS